VCTHTLWLNLLANDQNQANLPADRWIAVKIPQKPIDFYGVLFGSAKYLHAMQE
jgi:hypothetical protein